MAKKCSKCKIIKPSTSFYKRSDKPHLLQSHCISCVKLRRKLFRLENLDRFKKRDIEYHNKNKAKRNLYNKLYNAKHTKLRTEKDKLRYKTDPLFKLQTNIRNRIRAAIKSGSKRGSSIELLGCSIAFFKKYFESLFTKDMNWNKFMSGKIQIDHILPCNSFNLENSKEQQRCFHYTNLQPLSAKDNRSKWYKVKEVCYR